MAADFRNLSSLAAGQKGPPAERATKIESTAAPAKSLEADLLAMTEALATRDAELARLREALAASQARGKFLEANLHARTAALASIYASTSWRLTAPLRSVGGATRWFVRGSWAWITVKPSSRPRRMARSALLRTIRFVLARPSLTRILRRPLERFPSLKSVQRRIFAILLAAADNPALTSDGFFSERERFVHNRLKAALEKRAN
jgi:hypothetical protein